MAGATALFCLALAAGLFFADECFAGPTPGSRIVRDVVGEGSCAIFGMSADQSQLIALQKARAHAIDRAAGVRVVASTLVRNSAVALDLIRTYSRGFIVREKAQWLPIAQYQDSPDQPPIPEFRVRITADVALPEKSGVPLGLEARLNNKVFRRGERARLEIRAERESRVAVFNITADDKVVMVFPHPFEKDNFVSGDKSVVFPGDASRIRLVMQTLPGHSRDAEAFFVAAVAKDQAVDFNSVFGAGKPYALAAFFDRYADIAASAEEIILPYAVEGNE